MRAEFPYWMQFIAVLGPLISAAATVIVGAAVSVIAYRQWRIAHEKLLLDLFDKRFALYEQAREAVQTFWTPPTDEMSVEEHRNKRIASLHEVGRRARFLFDDEVDARIAQVRNALIDGNPATPWEEATPEERNLRGDLHRRALIESNKFPGEFGELVQKYMRITRKI